MKVKSLGLVALLSFGIAHADEPEIFQGKQFNAAMMAKAVNHYVAIGEPAAREELARLARRADQSAFQQHWAPITFTGQDIASRVSWMCLILWPVRPGNESRPPMFGGLYAIEGHVKRESFPLYPVAQSGATYFVLADAYVLGGHPETASHFLADCESHGSFRRQPVAVPTRREAQRDVSMLRQSSGWTAPRMPGSSQDSWEQPAWAFIQDQANSIQ